MSYYGLINELRYNELMRKSRNIGRLFPRFRQRVQGVANQGGVRLADMLPETWHFIVPSETKQSVSYDVYIRFKNMDEMIKKYASDRRLWVENEERVDYQQLAAEILNNVDLEADCACKADTYWGGEYIRTTRDAQYGRQEWRPPVERNPHEYGAFCKHAQLVFEVLPMYTTTFSSYLRRYWHEEIVDVEELTKKEWAGIQAAAGELAKKQAETPVGYTRGGKEVPIPKAAGEKPTGPGSEPTGSPEQERPPQKRPGKEPEKIQPPRGGTATKPVGKKEEEPKRKK